MSLLLKFLEKKYDTSRGLAFRALCSSLLICFSFAASADATIYYVATNGVNSNSGTSLATPFLTIQVAADIMVSGDVCYIRKGVYRETIRPANSGSAGNMITFMPYNGETVTVSAADEITGWTLYSNHIYVADMGWTLGEGFDQVFVDGVMVNRARWPNTGTDLLNPVQAAGTASADSISFSVSRPANYWVGGTVYGQFGDKWASQGGTITQSTPGGLLSVADKTLPWWFTGSGVGYITGIFGELDSPGEWFLKDGKLYLWAPNSVDPSSVRVEAKARKWVVNLTGRSYIRIQDLNLFGGSIQMRCDGSEINGVQAKYLSHFTKYTWNGSDASGDAVNGNNGIWVRGEGNIIKNSTFQFSAGSGILLDGGGKNTVARNIIRDMNYSGTYSCHLAVTTRSTGGNKVLFNTMFNAGRDIIQLLGAQDDEIMYNELYNAGRLCHDLGIIYHWGQDGRGTRIAYNWVYNNLAPHPNPGIYHDNYCRDFITDHNVIWNCEAGIRLNAPTDAMQVYNNTLFNCDDIGSNTYNAWPDNIPQYWQAAGYGNINNRVLANNLFLGTSPSSQLVNYADKDFRLKAGAAAIDAGVKVSPYTDGYLGQAPDKGAYEYGAVRWTAGHAGTGPAGVEDPSVRSDAVSDMTCSSAMIRGTLLSKGAATTSVSVFWGESNALQDKTTWANEIVFGSTLDSLPVSYRTEVTGLVPNQIYYYRYYASNPFGESWGEVVEFTPTSNGGSFSDSFESYPPGLSLAGNGGWTGNDGAGIISEYIYNPPVPPGYPLPDELHTKVLQVTDRLEHAVCGTPNQTVHFDGMVKLSPGLPPEGLADTVQVAICMDWQGLFNIWHRADEGGSLTHRWTALDHPPAGIDEWVRISITMDYRSDPSGGTFFSPRINGSLVPGPYGYKAPDNLTSPGPWYICADSPIHGGNGLNRISKLTLKGNLSADDIMISSNAFAHTGPGTTNGVPFLWFDAMGIARNPHLDTDGRGFTAAQAYVSGTDPTAGANSRFRILSTWKDAGFIHIQFTGNDSGAATPYVIQGTSDLVEGTWAVVDHAVPRAAAPETNTTWSGGLPAAPHHFYRILALP